LDFPVANNLISLDHSGLYSGLENITFEFWVNKHEDDENLKFIYHANRSAILTGIQVCFLSINVLHFRIRTLRESLMGVDSVSTFLKNEWYHVALIAKIKDDEAYVYKNGELDVSASSIGWTNDSISIASPTQFFIGNSGSSQDVRHVNAKIDEFRIWNHARTQDQIKRYMHIRLYGTETGLVAYYPMNEGTGSTAYDKSTNSNDGTITGASWVTP
jgi:hypothetical protein